MVIGIDASRAVRQPRTGSENYSWEIIQQIIRQDTVNTIRLYSPHLPKEKFAESPRTEWKILPQRRLWSQLRLAKELRDNPPDILFVPSHVVPIFCNVPSVVTIHGLEFRRFPRSYSSLDRRYLEFSTSVSASKAKRIIVPSESTKKDLVQFYKVKPDKITVIPHGYNQEVFAVSDHDDKPPIESPYIFFVGRIEERKNIRLLIDAFALLLKERKPISLVLSGKNGYGYDGIIKKIKSLPPSVQQKIILPGYLPQYDMVRYLRHARLFAFPSLYEGFGIPILEAMAVGTPVVASNSSSLPEVAGNAATLLPPNNALSWAAAFSRIINQPTTAKKMSEAGLAQVQHFSWAKAGTETLNVLNHVDKR